ncbi:unnamed protein product [Lota lota]
MGQGNAISQHHAVRGEGGTRARRHPGGINSIALLSAPPPDESRRADSPLKNAKEPPLHQSTQRHDQEFLNESATDKP